MSINSNIDICNLALSHLGVDSISNIETPVTNVEIICSAFYDIARQTLLRDGKWQFAIKQLSLAEDNTTPLFLYSHQSVEFPSDFVTLLYLVNTQFSRISLNDGSSFRIMGNRILTDMTAPYNMIYISDIKDVNKFTQEFKLLLSFYLAFLISEQVGASSDKKQYVSQMYTSMLAKAKSHNGQDIPAIKLDNSNYLSSYNTSATKEVWF